MEFLSDEYSRHLIGKEWLVKVDNEHSTPYLFKFYSSTIDLTCCILVTDTKTVWFESLSSNQFARRWREANRLRPKLSESSEQEDEWRVSTLEMLSAAHTVTNMPDLSFDLAKTNYSDFAFELESKAFKWKWEINLVGPRLSAEVLSKHLILPLISLTHLAFNSAESVSDMTDSDLEKAVDKVGRTARRTLDIHIKNVMSKPRLATTLRRMTAIFNFIPELPKIADKAGLETPESDAVRSTPLLHNRGKSSDIADVQMASPRAKSPGGDPTDWLDSATFKPDIEGRRLFDMTKAPAVSDDSATDISDGERHSKMVENEAKFRADIDSKNHLTSSDNVDATGPATSRKKPFPRKLKIMRGSSDDDSASAQPSKKTKQEQVALSDDDDDDDSDSEPARRGTSAGNSSKRGGTKQPIKRGGRRF